MNNKLEIVMDDKTLEAFITGESYGLSENDSGFNPWEQKTGKQTVYINGSPCLVHIDSYEPDCSCCVGEMSAYSWEMTMA